MKEKKTKDYLIMNGEVSSTHERSIRCESLKARLNSLAQLGLNSGEITLMHLKTIPGAITSLLL